MTDDRCELLAILFEVNSNLSRLAYSTNNSSIGGWCHDTEEKLTTLRARLTAPAVERAEPPMWGPRRLQCGKCGGVFDKDDYHDCQKAPPDEVTEEMLRSAREAFNDTYGSSAEKFTNAYRAMRAAAPKPEITDEVVERACEICWDDLWRGCSDDWRKIRKADMRRALEAVWPR